MVVESSRPPGSSGERWVRRAAGLIAAALLAAGCNGGGDSASTTTPSVAPDTTVVPPTSDGPATSTTTATTSAPPATEPPTTTTVPPPTSPSSSVETVPLTLPPTTTVPLDGLTADEREVVEAVLEAFRLFNEARLDPTNDDKYNDALERRTGAAREAGQAALDGYRRDGLREIPFPGAPASITPDPDTVGLDADGGVATVEVCWLNSNTLVETAGSDDGADRVVDDTIVARTQRYSVTKSSSQWLVFELEGLELFEGALTCG